MFLSKCGLAVEETIEAGITPIITKQIREKIRLQGKNYHSIRNTLVDPSGVDMRLITDSDLSLKNSPIKGGKQFVTSKLPGKWILG